MIRLGLIGCGLIAEQGHLPAIADTQGLQVVSALDPDVGRLAAVRDRFGIAATFTEAADFFRSDIDAVVICSPAPVHHHDVTMCARHKKPALCEKPLAMNEAEGQEMVDAMRAAGVPLYVGFTYRFSPVAYDIHRMVRAGEIGHVRSLRLFYVWDCHGKYAERGNPNSGLYDRRVGRMLEGGPMVDCGVHQIDLARWWTGSDIVHVNGHGAWVEREAFHFPDHVYLHADHADGAHTMVEMSFTYGHTAPEPRVEFAYELIGTDGLIRYNRQARYFERVNGSGVARLNWTDEKNFHGMYAAFERALRTGETADMPTGEDGLIATRLARLATEQAVDRRLGKPVRLEL